jgi:hypothetical protein
MTKWIAGIELVLLVVLAFEIGRSADIRLRKQMAEGNGDKRSGNV